MLDVLSTVLLYYAFIYWNIPYAVSEKFVNLFNLFKKDSDISRTEVRHFCLSKAKELKLTAWQMLLRILATPGILLGKLTTILAVVIPLLVGLIGTLLDLADNIVTAIISKIFYFLSILVYIIALPILISLALFGVTQGYNFLVGSLLFPWNCIESYLPPDTFIPFAYVQGFFAAVGAGELNLFFAIAGVILWAILSAVYFAIIYGIFEATTVPLWKVKENEKPEEPKGLFKKCLNALKDFFKNTRIPYTCRESEDCKDTLDNYIYHPMNVAYFVGTCILLFIFLIIWVPASGHALPLTSNIIEFVLATGVPQILISFAISSLMGLGTHKLYNKLPEKIRSAVESKLTDAVISIAKSLIQKTPITFTTPDKKDSGEYFTPPPAGFTPPPPPGTPSAPPPSTPGTPPPGTPSSPSSSSDNNANNTSFFG